MLDFLRDESTDSVLLVQLKGYSIVETICIIVIFVISGLVLKTEELLAAIKHPLPLLYGLVAILGITPMLGFATIHIPFQPREFAIGMFHLHGALRRPLIWRLSGSRLWMTGIALLTAHTKYTS